MTEIYFRQRLASIMLDNKYDRRVRHRKSGKLDLTRLPKAAMGSERVFTRKEERKGKRYNVVICSDVSGSMGDPVDYRWGYRSNGPARCTLAAEAASRLASALTHVGVGVGVVAFGVDNGNWGDGGTETILKLTNRRLGPKDEKLIHTKLNRAESGTPTALGLSRSYKMLRNEDAENIVVVLTDGQPNNAKAARDMIHAHPKIKTLGIGIGVNVENTHKACVVNDADSLYPQFLDLLSKEIERK